MRKWALILVATLILMPMVIGCSALDGDVPPPPAEDAALTTVRNIANTNTGSIQAVGARVAALEGRAAGEVTKAELDALAGQVTALSAKVTELETTIAEWDGTGSPDGPTGVASVTRWRPRVTFDSSQVVQTGTSTVITSDFEMYLKEIDPRTIKEADVYVFVLGISNTNTVSITIKDLVCNILLQPSDDTYVSDDTDAYQVSGPYNIFWNVDVRESSSTGICRFIELETDSLDLRIDAGSVASPKIIEIELEFELVYE